MNLNLESSFFIVGGAGSGFGKAVTIALLEEGAEVLGISRTTSKLESIKSKYGNKFDFINMDLTDISQYDKIDAKCKGRIINGLFVNAGGPPSMSFLESNIEDWDDAYKIVVRWKIAFVKLFMNRMIDQNYGRILFLESVSVKQPIQNLVLSNALRMSIIGAAKTLADEVSKYGITINVLGPGYHNTAAMNRLFSKKSELENLSIDEARALFENSIPVKKMGQASDLASLAIWLLSEKSSFVTGQTILLDGGFSKATL